MKQQRPFFHLLAKPAGARCNLAFRYCFQGGEPTLMSIDSFSRRSVQMETKYRRPGMIVENTIQTSGTREMHDAYRSTGRRRGVSTG